MEGIEKTVFISYRRANVPWALAIYQYLTSKGYDVFYDFMSIGSGDFEQIISENIKARAHFLILLTPSAIERCSEPGDWLRREIEIAIDCKRNIIPILLEGFDFGAPDTKKYLTGKLENIQKYQGLRIYAEYFYPGMDRLCDKFLRISLDQVKHPPILHPISPEVQKIIEKQKRIIEEQEQVKEKVLSSQEWFERAYQSKQPEEQIRLYTKAIELDPGFTWAYNNRGIIYDDLKQYKKAIKDFNKAIELDPGFTLAYNNRGSSYHAQKQYEKAVEDFNKVIEINPEYTIAYHNRGNCFIDLKQYVKAIEDFNKAIELDPMYIWAYINRGISYNGLQQYKNAIEDFNKAIGLDAESGAPLYNLACSYGIQAKPKEATIWLRKALLIDSHKYCELVRNDHDFDEIRNDPLFQNLLKEFCDNTK